MKFGIVGVIAFVIDWGILNLLVGIFHMHNVLAATVSFIISLIFNYLASMKFVFKHRDGNPVDADDVLARYKDWHDTSEYPVSSRQKKIVSHALKSKPTR